MLDANCPFWFTQLLKLEFHDTDTDFLAKILADTSNTRD